MDSFQQLGIIILIADIIIAYAVYRMMHKDKEEPPDEIGMCNSMLLQRDIQELAAKTEQLEALDNMIIDLQLCRPSEVIRAFRMEWQSTGGKDYDFEFLADGQNASTEYLMQLAREEREQLNAEIAARITDLYQKASRLTVNSCSEYTQL